MPLQEKNDIFSKLNSVFCLLLILKIGLEINIPKFIIELFKFTSIESFSFFK